EAEVLGQVSVWCSMLHDLGEVEVKHGVRLHLYNLHTDETGNPESPKKISPKVAAPIPTKPAAQKRKLPAFAITAVAALALSAAGWLLTGRKTHALSATDTIVLADFTNTTGDAVFDGTLRQGLSIQLEQSPLLSIVSDQQIQQALRLMDRKPDA